MVLIKGVRYPHASFLLHLKWGKESVWINDVIELLFSITVWLRQQHYLAKLDDDDDEDWRFEGWSTAINLDLWGDPLSQLNYSRGEFADSVHINEKYGVLLWIINLLKFVLWAFLFALYELWNTSYENDYKKNKKHYSYISYG